MGDSYKLITLNLGRYDCGFIVVAVVIYQIYTTTPFMAEMTIMSMAHVLF